MDTLKCIKKSIGHVNDLTQEMDSYLKDSISGFYTYIYNSKCNNKYPIRYPGATRGHIEVDENDIIINIKLYIDKYETNTIYNDSVVECFEKYVGKKFII